MHNVDLTEGSPWKKVLLFTIPLLLATILTDLYSLVDNLVLGKFVAEYYSGAASASPVINLFGMFMVGLGVGFSSFTSKYIGEKNEEETHRSFVRSIVLVVIIEFILYTTALLLIDPLLSLVNISKEADATLYEGAFYKCLLFYLPVLLVR